MRLLRILLGAGLGLLAMLAALFATVVVVITALLGFLTGGRLRGRLTVNRGGARPTGARGPAGPHGQGEVIDIEATRVPEKRIEG